MNPAKFILFMACFFVFAKALQYFMILKNLLSLRFKKVDGEIKQLNELPEYLETLLLDIDIRLQKLGFSLSHLHLLDSLLVSNFNQQWNIVYFNEDNNCYANVIISPLPDIHEPVKVEFNNIFSDKSRLTTPNGTQCDVIDEVPNVILNDPFAPTLQEQYTAHAEKLQNLNRKSIQLNPHDYLANEIRGSNEYLTSLIEKALLKSQDQTTWQLRLLPAIKHALKTLRGVKKLKALKAAQSKAVGAGDIKPVEIPIEAEVNAYLHLEEVLNPKGSGLGWKLMVFVVGLAIGIAIFGTAFSFGAALFIIGAFIVHELGHYIAMLIFGYRDMQILILPFGAATLGEKTDATVLQKAVVFLSGPALGLIVGTLCMIAGTRTEIKPLFFGGIFSVVLSYLNLLPIVPLDGGRVFEVALFSKVPVLKSVFLVISLSIMAIAAIILRDPFLIFFAISMAIGLRSQLLVNSAHSKTKKRIKTQQIQPDKESILREIFQLLKQKSFAAFPFIKKYQISKNLITELMQESPGLTDTIVSLALYFLVIILPVLIAVPAVILLAIKDGI